MHSICTLYYDYPQMLVLHTHQNGSTQTVVLHTNEVQTKDKEKTNEAELLDNTSLDNNSHGDAEVILKTYYSYIVLSTICRLIIQVSQCISILF
jgi:hypothetical protein